MKKNLGLSFLSCFLPCLFFSLFGSNILAQNASLNISGSINAGDTLSYDKILYDFESGAQGWEKVGTNVDSVYSTQSGQAIPPFNGNYLWYETNATNAPSDFRAAEVTTGGIDLLNNYLVGAVRTWGLTPTNNFILKIKVWGPTEADTVSAIDTIHADDWYFFSLNLSNWQYADNITKLWIGIANRDTGSLPAAWIGKCAIDQIGLKSKQGGISIPYAFKGSLYIIGSKRTNDSLLVDKSLFTFEGNNQGWTTGNGTIDSVSTQSSLNTFTSYEGEKMLVVYPNAETQLRVDYRSAQVTLDNVIDLTNDVLVGAVLTEGAGPYAKKYSLKIKLWSIFGDSATASTNIDDENWNFFALDVSSWSHANSVNKIWIGCASSDPDSMVSPNTVPYWGGRFLIDNIGIKNKRANFTQTTPIVINNSSWFAIDGLGRPLPTYNEVGPPNANKYVGVFYFVWHSTPGAGGGNEVYDNTKLIQANPDNPAYGPRYSFHWWGEPEAGYYRADDPWVIRRNLQMLSDAGVDFLYFDVSNGVTYLNVVNTLCSISMQMRREGIKTPYVVFLTHANSGTVINELYNSFYSNFEFSPLWFIWEGKPLILGDSTDATLSTEAKEFFTFRNSWAWMDPTKPDQWQWIDNYPQDYGWHLNAQKPEQIPVAVASHPVNNIGESYHDGAEPPINKYKLTEFTGQGLHFAEQWERALEVDPSVVMVTGWNEWIAQRFVAPGDGNPDFLGQPAINAPASSYFVDNYNAEFNRDIEPMKGGYTDNHYYQLVQYIRRFKGMAQPQPISKKTIKINGDFSEWLDVTPTFSDSKGDTEHRDFYRYDKKEIYVNNTGRNDIVESKATYDNDMIYFYVQTADNLTPYTDKNWMLLFIDSDKNHATGWEGYDYVVNLNVKSDSVSTLSEWRNSDSIWVEVSDLNYKVKGNQMEIGIPKSLIGQNSNDVSFYFHWADNIQKLNDITEFFLNGDSAPNRRFNYYFESSLPTDVSADKNQIPNRYVLMQNYPNPFNPSTTIKYTIPKSGVVEINVYNILGQLVKRLVNSMQKAGSYSIVWDGKNDFGQNVSSGVYIYTMKSNSYFQLKKMILLK